MKIVDDSFQEERRRELNGIPPPEQKVTATFKVSYSRLANFHQLRCLIGRETGIRRRTGDAAAILRLPGSSENVRAVEGAEKRGSRLRQRELRWKIQGLPNLSFFPPSSTVLCSSSLNILLGEIRWRRGEFCILKRSIKEKCLNVCSNELLIGGKSTSGGKKRFLVNDWKIISKGNSFFFFIFFLNLIIKEWTWNNSDWIRVSFRKFHFKLQFLSSLRPRRINEMTNPLIKVHRQGRICVYRWPHPSNLPCKTRSGRSASDGLCDDYPHSESIKLVVRLYVVKGARYIFDSSCDDEAHGIESIPQASTCSLRIP